VYSVTHVEAEIDSSHFFGGIYTQGSIYTIVHTHGNQVLASISVDGMDYIETSYVLTDTERERVLLISGNNNHLWLLKSTGNNSVYQLKNLSHGGVVLASREIQIALDEGEYVEFTHLTVDESNNILLATTDMLYVFDSAANFLFNLGVTLIDLGLDSRGTPIVSYFANLNGDVEIRTVDIPNQTWGDAYRLKNNISGFLRSNRFDVLFYNQQGVFGLNYSDSTTISLFTWTEIDIPAMDIMFVLSLNDDRLICVLFSETSAFFYISPNLNLPYLERKTITLGAYHISQSFFEQVLRFNRQSEYFRISIVDYASYNTGLYPFRGLSMFLNAIRSRDAHDLIDLSRLSQRKDLLVYMADLYDKFEHSVIDVENINETVLELFEVDGELRSITPYFYIQTAITRNSLWGNISSVEDFHFESVTTNAVPFLYLTPETAIIRFYEWFLSNYYDPTTGEFKSNDNYLESLLDLFELLPHDNDEQDRLNILRGNNAYLLLDEIRNFNDIQLYHALLEDDLLFAGIPTGESFEHILVAPISIAISAYAPNQELALAFIEHLLSDGYQKLNSVHYFPVLNSAMNYKIERERQVSWYSGLTMDDFSVDISGASEDDISMILSVIQSSTSRVKYDIEHFESGLFALQTHFLERTRRP